MYSYRSEAPLDVEDDGGLNLFMCLELCIFFDNQYLQPNPEGLKKCISVQP